LALQDLGSGDAGDKVPVSGPRLGSWNFKPGDPINNQDIYNNLFLEDAKVALETEEWYGE
jgi:hypothetical protein